MTSAILAVIARERANDLRRASARERAATECLATTEAPAIELRLAVANEAPVVRRLCALDEAAELEGQVLLALINGDPVAGLSLRDRRVVANPFVDTREAVALLRLRAEHLATPRASHRLARLLAPRAA